MAKTFDDMPKIENPLKNELRQRVVLGLSSKMRTGRLCLPDPF